MNISIPGRVVVFDYGEVISRPPSEADRATIVAAAGVDADVFWPAYWAHRNDLDQGLALVDDYWSRVAFDLGVTWTPAQRQQLWVSDFRGWFSSDAGTIEVLADLHAGNTRLALLSNAGFDFGDPLRHAPFAAYFEEIFISAELGIIKPDAAIFRHVADVLGIGFDAFVFVDNKQENVDGAIVLGATGHLFTGAAGLRDFLVDLAG